MIIFLEKLKRRQVEIEIDIAILKLRLLIALIRGGVAWTTVG